jgi:peroxiredoxin (alkyl hydroperoxide reductase subunit C)
MQTSDANKVATPEGWQPGDKVIVPPPQANPSFVVNP